MRHLPSLVFAVLLVACGIDADRAGDARAVTIDSSGAVPVLTVSGEPPSWTLESLAVIRPEAELGFSNIRSIALDPNGGVWVADVGEGRVSRWLPADDGGLWVKVRLPGGGLRF